MSTFPFLLALALVTDRGRRATGAVVLAGRAGRLRVLAFLGVSGP